MSSAHPPSNAPRRVLVSPKRKAAAHLMGIAAGIVRLFNRAVRRREMKRVVILEPFGMGDVISLEPLVSGLLSGGWEVVIVAQQAWRALFTDKEITSRWINCRVPWSSYDSSQKYRALFSRDTREFFSIFHKAAAGAVGIDPRGDMRSILLLQLAGCREVLTLESYIGSDLKIPSYAARLVESPDTEKKWQNSFRFLAALGIDLQAPEGPRLGMLEPGTNRTVGVMPVAPWPGRIWPGDRWRELCRRLSAQGWQPIGLCGPGQAGEARRMLGEVTIYSLTTIDDWRTQFAGLASLITLDSGPMHLADAMGVPLVALFGPGQLPKWAPSHPLSRVVHHQDDPKFRPVHQIDANIQEGKKWMEMISVDEVMEAFQSLTQQVSEGRLIPNASQHTNS